MEAVQEAEAARGGNFTFDWVVRTRPDVRMFGPWKNYREWPTDASTDYADYVSVYPRRVAGELSEPTAAAGFITLPLDQPTQTQHDPFPFSSSERLARDELGRLDQLPRTDRDLRRPHHRELAAAT